jgi:Tfp pilus assembly protein PilP
MKRGVGGGDLARRSRRGSGRGPSRGSRKYWRPVVGGLGLMALLGGDGAAVETRGEPGAPAATSAPNLGGVKDVVRGAVNDAKDSLPGMAKGPGKGPAAPPAPAAAPSGPTDPAAALAARLTMLRRKTLKDDDFQDNDERNRDPFRSYLRLFTSKEGPKSPQVPAIFDKFALEELTLIAIVSGDANPRAMFRDPAGVGQSIKRGDYVSKYAARVTKILSDRVILELNEMTGNGETKAVEKPVLVNPEGAQK